MTNLKEYRQATEITAFFMFSVFLVHPVLAPYMKLIGLSNFQTSLLFALFPLTMIFTSAIFGSLSDSIGRKKIIMFGILLEVVGMTLYIVGTPYLALVGRFLEALAFVAVTIVGLAKVQDALDTKTRGKYSGISLTIMQVGKMVAPVIGGFLADYWFVKAPFIFSMFSLMLMLWLISIHETMDVNHRFSRSEFNLLEKMRMFFSDRRLKGMGILGMVMHASIPITLVVIPIYITETLSMQYRFVGYAFFAMQFFLLFQFYAGKLCDRFNKAKLVLLGVFIYGASIIFLAFTPNYTSLVAVLLVAGIGSAFWNVAAWSLMSDIGESAHKEGFVIGTYMSVAKIGSFLSFVGGGFIMKYFSADVFMLLVGSMILAGGVVASFFMFDKKGSARRTGR
ncbi:MFS transporter [Nanoarchaeota archaeon]